MADFQTVPFLGIKFAGNLISPGFYSLDELKEKTVQDYLKLCNFRKG
jgi:hypothetical protein